MLVNILLGVLWHYLLELATDSHQIISVSYKVFRHEKSPLLSKKSQGFLSAGVPAFIPLDMDDPGKGMRGEFEFAAIG